MSDNHSNEGREVILVRHAVYVAAGACQRKSLTDPRGLTDWNLAEEQKHLCHEEGDHHSAAFWHEVYLYLMELECVSADAMILVTVRGRI